MSGQTLSLVLQYPNSTSTIRFTKQVVKDAVKGFNFLYRQETNLIKTLFLKTLYKSDRMAGCAQGGIVENA